MSRIDELTSWHSDWSSTKAVVFGLGVTGFSVADTLVELGATVLVLADKADNERIDVLQVLGVRTEVGQSVSENIELIEKFNPDLVITSPGVKPSNEVLQWVIGKSIPLWTDIDLAWRVRDKFGKPSQWFCITGTNGKTTVTQLVEAILLQAGVRVIACGNIGLPILDAVRNPAEFEALVVELSSFQLHYTNHIEPTVSAILNIADDHLDWHGSFDKYAKAKGKIYNNTKIACIYNAEDQTTYELMQASSNTASAQAVGFTKFTPAPNEIGWVEDILVDRAYVDKADTAEELATLADLKNIPVISPHLMSNLSAAAAIVRAVGIQPGEISAALQNFKLDAHRIELVAENDGVKWVDDSKATNPHAAAAALNSFDSIIWVVGGLLKGVDISDLVKQFEKRIKAAIVIGIDREPVLQALASFAPNTQVLEINVAAEQVMSEVVSAAKAIAVSGDTVLLAPAAASMDQFIDYADRGSAFAKAVLEEVNK